MEKLNFAEKVTELPFWGLVKITLFVNLTAALLPVFLLSRLPPQVPLFYGMPIGEDQLSSATGLILPPLVSLGITLTNISLSLAVSSDFLKKILQAASVIATFFSTITVVKIILLVGSF